MKVTLGAYETLVGFVMATVVISIAVLLTTSWIMALTTGNNIMNKNAMPIQFPIMETMMNQRRLYRGGFNGVSGDAGSSLAAAVVEGVTGIATRSEKGSGFWSAALVVAFAAKGDDVREKDIGGNRPYDTFKRDAVLWEEWFSG